MSRSMHRTIHRLTLGFLAVFAVLAAATMVWQIGWVWPRKDCEGQRKWWDNSERVCAQPVLISDITGRVISDDASRAEALKAVGRAPAPGPSVPGPSVPSASGPAPR